MSAAAAAAPDNAAPAPARGKKKLILIILAVLLVIGLAGGGAAFWLMKKRAAEAAAALEADADGEGGAAAPAKKADKHAGPPTFLPLEGFVVNLADRDVDRFAQVGITLEVADAKAAEQLKLYMPAIRDGILMILAHKTSAELLDRAGKEKLASEVLEASVAPLPHDEAEADAPAPVRKVNFSSFIIQ
jgi:flagellar FliL protein